MAKPVNPKNTHVSVKLTPGEREALEDYRWKNRMEVSAVLREAVQGFFTAKGITVTEPGDDAPAEAPAEPPAEAPKSRK